MAVVEVASQGIRAEAASTALLRMCGVNLAMTAPTLLLLSAVVFGLEAAREKRLRFFGLKLGNVYAYVL